LIDALHDLVPVLAFVLIIADCDVAGDRVDENGRLVVAVLLLLSMGCAAALITLP
jgi:hypothetical protein